MKQKSRCWHLRGFIVVCLLSVPMVACNSNSSHDNTDFANCLVVSPSSGNAGEPPEYNNQDIDGTITNNCGRNFSYVAATFKLYDSTGSTVGEAIGSADAGLSSGETFKFHAYGTHMYERFSMSNLQAN